MRLPLRYTPVNIYRPKIVTKMLTPKRKQRVSMCLVLVTMLLYRDCWHKATQAILENNAKKPQFLSEEDEVQAMMLADDLVMTKKVPCGKEKCFFLSKSNAQQGYLVARCGSDASNSDKYNRLVQGWQLATRLQKEYHIQHFLRSPPETIPVSDHLASIINENLWFDSQDLPVNQVNTRRKAKPRFAIHSFAYIQKVQVAPSPNLLLACAHSNRPHLERHLDNFLMGVDSKTFVQSFRKNLNCTRELLQKESSLIKDFQVLLDSRGEIYHLDFDRCFHTRENDETAECFEYLDEVEQRIQERLTDPFHPKNIKPSKRVVCGKSKCLYKLKSNATIGYLVARTDDSITNTTTDDFKTIEAGWQLAQNLTWQYGIQHFLLAPPMNIIVSRDLAVPLNRNLWSEKSQYHLRNPIRFPNGTSVYVQKVKLAPQPNLSIGSRQSKVDLLDRVLSKFLASVKDQDSFVRRFRENLANMRLLVQAEPCLANDFQALVDTKGTLYSLDFDKCFLTSSAVKMNITSEELAECLTAIDDIESRVYRAISKRK